MKAYRLSSSDLEESQYFSSVKGAKTAARALDLVEYEITECTVSPRLRQNTLAAALLNNAACFSHQEIIYTTEFEQ